MNEGGWRMREIKFRVWDKNRGKMYGEFTPDLLIQFDGKLQSINTNLYVQGVTNTPQLPIMQYTGLKDRNGNEIYQGDIIRWHDVVTIDYPITFTDGVFCLNDNPSENFFHHREDINTKWEVIGNIYENPELLKAE